MGRTLFSLEGPREARATAGESWRFGGGVQLVLGPPHSPRVASPSYLPVAAVGTAKPWRLGDDIFPTSLSSCSFFVCIFWRTSTRLAPDRCESFFHSTNKNFF